MNNPPYTRIDYSSLRAQALIKFASRSHQHTAPANTRAVVLSVARFTLTTFSSSAENASTN